MSRPVRRLSSARSCEVDIEELVIRPQTSMF